MLDTSAYQSVTFPIIGYVFIGITTLALSYITFIDNSENEKAAATTILPFSTNTSTSEYESSKTGGKRYGKTIKKTLKSKKSGSSKKGRK